MLNITFSAIAGFQKMYPGAKNNNSFMLNIDGWDPAFNLTRHEGRMNYSSFQEFSLTSAGDVHDNPIWYLAVDDMLSKTSTQSYQFTGNMSTDILSNQYFKFNVTDVCDDKAIVQPRDALFEGNFLKPDNESTPEDWLNGASIPLPSISGQFDGHSAWVVVHGLFSAYSDNTKTQLVGSIEIRFNGKLDEIRSDQLLFGKENPEWNATLGFKRGSVLEDGSDSAATALRLDKSLGYALSVLAVLFVLG
ncbi:hypothetical protein CNMCM6106_004331 [Aspergillus hiratsukae]|nr:hypothetical protein CNMCM6106_004331 [Aspergillus hiratsukae]